MTYRLLALAALAALAVQLHSASAHPAGEKAAETNAAAAEKYPAPPDGYDKGRDGDEKGKVETVEYDSTTVGVKRKAVVYTPPGYAKEKTYPVLYLLHGIGGDENEWRRGGAPDVILENLYADKKAVPMIVVMEKGYATWAGAAAG